MVSVAPRVAALALLAGPALGGACGGGCGSGAPAAASSAPGPAPSRPAAPSSSAAVAGPPTGSPSPPATAPSPSTAPPGLDCEHLLGAARASRALGRPLVAARAAAGAGQCTYTPTGGPGDGSALVDLVVACGEAAAPLARSVLSRLAAGDRELALGQKGVLVERKGQGVAQFLVQRAPCAVEVTAVPAERVEAVAREVAASFGEGRDR